MSIKRLHRISNKTEEQYINERIELKSCTDCVEYDKCIIKYDGPPMLKGIYGCDDFNPNIPMIKRNFKAVSTEYS